MNPTCFGRYILLDRIARGGMGEVFVAVARGMWRSDRFYAVKKILPSLSRDPEFLARFRDEARLVIPLSHPNVVQVLEVGSAGDEYFIAMEYVEGPNLGELLSALWHRRHQERLPVTAALFIIRELLGGLDYCHRRTDSTGLHLGVVHRDVSPSNVLVSYDGAVKLADFGLALSSLKGYRTQPNLVLGHLGYMAPEAMDGRRVDLRADLYCAGVLLFELLTCQRFVQGDDPVFIRQSLRNRAAVRPSSLRGDLPPEVDDIVGRALAENPQERFPSARAFLDAVQKSLIRIDALFSGRRLAERVLRPLLQPEEQQQELRRLAAGIDPEEVEERRPAARTVCFGEAIPLGADNRSPVLTLLNEVYDGDTQPMRTALSERRPVVDEAAKTDVDLDDTLPPELPPRPRRRTLTRPRVPMRRRSTRRAGPDPDLTPAPDPVRWIEVETVQ